MHDNYKKWLIVLCTECVRYKIYIYIITINKTRIIIQLTRIVKTQVLQP